MNRTEILETAERHISADRNHQYGEPEDNFSLIAEHWSVYLGDRDGLLDAFDVAVMMSLMKVARLSKRPDSPDSAVDLAGYAACAGEILENTHRATDTFKAQVASLCRDAVDRAWEPLADSSLHTLSEAEREHLADAVDRARHHHADATAPPHPEERDPCDVPSSQYRPIARKR